MTTVLDQKRADLVTALRDYDAELAAERQGVRAALDAPLAAHEPAKRIGRLSSKVQVRAAEDEADRKRIVEDLVAKGYHRARVMQRLEPGLFDVNHRDGAVTVRWWPMAEQEAA